MQIVIDIDENVFTRLFDNGIEDYAIVNDDLFAIAKSIRKGTVLPEKHGRLGDLDALEQYVIDKYSEGEQLAIDISDAPTILEAWGNKE